jgi:hypothetical protein
VRASKQGDEQYQTANNPRYFTEDHSAMRESVKILLLPTWATLLTEKTDDQSHHACG